MQWYSRKNSVKQTIELQILERQETFKFQGKIYWSPATDSINMKISPHIAHIFEENENHANEPQKKTAEVTILETSEQTRNCRSEAPSFDAQYLLEMKPIDGRQTSSVFPNELTSNIDFSSR